MRQEGNPHNARKMTRPQINIIVEPNSITVRANGPVAISYNPKRMFDCVVPLPLHPARWFQSLEHFAN